MFPFPVRAFVMMRRRRRPRFRTVAVFGRHHECDVIIAVAAVSRRRLRQLLRKLPLDLPDGLFETMHGFLRKKIAASTLRKRKEKLRFTVFRGKSCRIHFEQTKREVLFIR
jgi:hypothetical protein